jgi:hypothetical protein
MVNIEGIQVDIVGSLRTLLANWALYIIEFEYDSRIMVCHVLDKPVEKGISGVIKKILSPKVESVDLRESLLNSKFITVEVKKEYSANDMDVLLFDKYQMIKSNKSYYPYGYNFLLLTSNSYEKHYAYTLHNTLINNLSISATNHIISLASNKRGKKPKAVYRYDKKSGFFINSYDSIKAASEDTGICKSSISMCCKGYINTAGNYIWSFEKKQAVDLPEDRRRKQPKYAPSSEEIAKRQKEFIQKNK